MTRTNNTDLKDVWQTPPEVIKWLESGVSSIDLDPCAGEDTDIGRYNYTKADDGLSKDWFGAVFVNPPFSKKKQWLEKAVNEVKRDEVRVVYVVTPDSTDTKSWWHEYIAAESNYVWFSKGRISYIDPETGEKAGSPTFGTAISVFGQPEKKVLQTLAESGQLTKTINPSDL